MNNLKIIIKNQKYLIYSFVEKIINNIYSKKKKKT